MTWGDYELALPRALEDLEERYPAQRVDILETFDIAWIGWEGDSRGALITVDGVPKLVAIEQTISEDDFEQQVIERMPEYRRLLDETTRVLRSLWYRRAEIGDRRDLPSYAERLLTEVYRRVGHVEHMGLSGRKHVAEALRNATEEAVQFPEEIELRRREFEVAARAAAAHLPDVKAETDIQIMEAATRMQTDGWTGEDDRLVMIGRIAEHIETMPLTMLERVMDAVQGIRADDLADLNLENPTSAND